METFETETSAGVNIFHDVSHEAVHAKSGDDRYRLFYGQFGQRICEPEGVKYRRASQSNRLLSGQPSATLVLPPAVPHASWTSSRSSRSSGRGTPSRRSLL